MPYTPAESLATMQHFYSQMGKDIWGPFGFYDAFNEDADWVSPSYLAIDQGTIVPMIENHRTGLPWKTFMKSDVAVAIVKKLRGSDGRGEEPALTCLAKFWLSALDSQLSAHGSLCPILSRLVAM